MPDTRTEKNKRYCEERKARYAADPEWREELKAYARERYAKHKETINEKRRTSLKAKEYERGYNRRPEVRRRIRNAVFLAKYGITMGQYDELVIAQNGVCAICEGDIAVDKWKSGLRNLQVDHCHETGKVRGLLCFHCNTGLGHFRDSPELLTKAIVYLSK